MVEQDLNQLEREMWQRIAEIEAAQPGTDRFAGWDPVAWQQEQAQRRQQREQDRAERRRQRRLGDRRSFGEETWGASEAHRSAQTNIGRLRELGLPVLMSEQELADHLDIPLTRLRWLTTDRPADPVWHYVRFTIPKRRSGERVILAPKRELKAIQRHILDEIVGRVPGSEQAHGFVPGRSIVTNAEVHVGQNVVLNMDLKDFFPSITYPRVRGVFISLGYSFAVGSTLALLCTGRERVAYERDGKPLYISIGERHLVQGAPTSPAISNLVARKLDRRLAGLAASKSFNYTRYADDLSFSGAALDDTLRILDVAQRIIADEGFAPHPDKIRIYRQSSRQIVTGLVVNNRVNVPRTLRRQLRAILHQAQHTGLEAQNTNGHPHFRAYLQGLIAHIHDSNAAAAHRLRQHLDMVPD